MIRERRGEERARGRGNGGEKVLVFRMCTDEKKEKQFSDKKEERKKVWTHFLPHSRRQQKHTPAYNLSMFLSIYLYL